jgi:hypothetical protein
VNPQGAVHAHLSADEDVSAAVGGRIFTGVAPQFTALPYISIQLISGSSVHHLGGAAGLADARVQIDAWAPTSLAAWDISELIRESMDGRLGTLGEDTIQWSGLDSRGADADEPQDGSERWIHRVRSDYLIWYPESVPVHA